MGEVIKTNNGKEGGVVGGKPHSQGGVKVVIEESGRPAEIEQGEVVVNKHAAKIHWRELSRTK